MYSFFGVPVKLNIVNLKYKDILLNELKVYKINSEAESNTLLITDDWCDFQHQILANNPSTHIFCKNVIYIKDKLVNVAFEFDSNKRLIKVFFKLNFAKNSIHRYLRKWLNMQFTNRIENIGQIFHESIMVPLTFFYENLVPIHASGVVINNQAFLLGGTGGVGKTTIELDLCLHQNYAFLTDDIAIVNTNEQVYPNHNSPKIYGYNLGGNKKLKSKLFKNETIIGKLQWLFHKYIFGLNKVRRKISTFQLYQNVAEKPKYLTAYFILNKNNCKKMSIEKLAIDEAIKMSLEVIMTEYSYFFNHIRFHVYNSISCNLKPIITVKELETKWKKNLFKILEEKDIRIINIPLTIEHTKFKVEMNSLIKEEINLNLNK